jgi:hypothetical protein
VRDPQLGWQHHAIPDRGHFGQNRDGDLGRRLAAEVDADRAMRFAQLRVVHVEQLKPFAPHGIIGARTNGADVEAPDLSVSINARSSSLGSGERQHRAVAVKVHVDHDIVRHRMHQFHAFRLPAGMVFLTGIAYGDVVVHADGDLRREARGGRRGKSLGKRHLRQILSG